MLIVERDMHAPSPSGALDAIHSEYLNTLDGMTAHREIAIAAAMDYCAEWNVTPPHWLVHAAAEMLLNSLRKERPSKRGRAAGHLARYRQDMIDFERWDSVKETRWNQKRLYEDLVLCRSHPNYQPHLMKSKVKMQSFAGRTWDEAYVCAAKLLRGRDAYAGADSMKTSYLKVRKALKSRAAANRYYIVDESFWRKMGLPHVLHRKEGTKLLPLFDLT